MGRNRSVSYSNLLLSLSDAIDLANSEISKHQQRTAYIAWETAKSARLNEELIKDLFIAALFHDVGALTVEEKTALHKFETADLEKHCIRGEILLQTIPQHERIASIVRFHHTEWQNCDEPIDKDYVTAAQILYLADYLERLIDRDICILHQKDTLIRKIKELSVDHVYPDIIDMFLSISDKEEFWLDLTSPRLYSILNNQGPLGKLIVDYDAIEILSKFCRDLIDYKSPYTATHSAGVSACAEVLSRLMGLTDQDIQEMRIAANFHDIGKTAIPNSILEKPGKLTDNEQALVACHAYYSHYIISTIGGLGHIAERAAFHHERLDGSGYPFHCYEMNMSTGARIMAVADIYTALAEDRPYRAGMPQDKMIGIMRLMAASNAIDKNIVGLLADNFKAVNEHVSQSQLDARDFYEYHLKPYYGNTAPAAPRN